MVEIDDYERKQKSRKDGLLDPWSPAALQTETPKSSRDSGGDSRGLIGDLSKSFRRDRSRKTTTMLPGLRYLMFLRPTKNLVILPISRIVRG